MTQGCVAPPLGEGEWVLASWNDSSSEPTSASPTVRSTTPDSKLKSTTCARESVMCVRERSKCVSRVQNDTSKEQRHSRQRELQTLQTPARRRVRAAAAACITAQQARGVGTWARPAAPRRPHLPQDASLAVPLVQALHRAAKVNKVERAPVQLPERARHGCGGQHVGAARHDAAQLRVGRHLRAPRGRPRVTSAPRCCCRVCVTCVGCGTCTYARMHA